MLRTPHRARPPRRSSFARSPAGSAPRSPACGYQDARRRDVRRDPGRAAAPQGAVLPWPAASRRHRAGSVRTPLRQDRRAPDRAVRRRQRSPARTRFRARRARQFVAHRRDLRRCVPEDLDPARRRDSAVRRRHRGPTRPPRTRTCPTRCARSPTRWALHTNAYDYASTHVHADDTQLKRYREVFTSTVYETEHRSCASTRKPANARSCSGISCSGSRAVGAGFRAPAAGVP